MDFNLLVWLFAIAITLHNLEEALWLPAWSKTAGLFHVSVGDLEFRFAIFILTFLVYIAVFFAFTGGQGSVGAYLICGYALVMFLNVIFPHLLATIFMKKYAPGTATALALNLPITIMLMDAGIKEGYIDFSVFVYAGPLIVIGIMILISLLFFVGREAARAISVWDSFFL